MVQDKPVTPKLVELAAISGAHGVTGEVRLKLFGEGISQLKQYKSFNDGALTLSKIRDDHKGGAIARFAEVSDRNAAEALRGTTIAVPRSSLPDLPEGEYYHVDLLDLAAVSQSGTVIGRSVAVENFGAQDVLEIERPSEEGKRPRRFMIPMNAAAVIEWDNERLVVGDDFADG